MSVKMHKVQVGDYLHVLGQPHFEVTGIEKFELDKYAVYWDGTSIPYDYYHEDGKSLTGPKHSIVAHFSSSVQVGIESAATSDSKEVDPVCSDEVGPVCDEVGPVRDEALRFNQGKTPYGNLPLDLLDGAARVMAYGEKRYGRANYRKGYTDLMSPYHSLLRHALALQPVIEQEQFQEGGPLYDESGEAHVHHIITSALILIQAMRKKGVKV